LSKEELLQQGIGLYFRQGRTRRSELQKIHPDPGILESLSRQLTTLEEGLPHLVRS
jgi:hypothetical protein